MRRFIAGALCPECGAQDKIVMHVGDANRRRECVQCGYVDSLDDAGTDSELPTRVNRVRAGEPVLPHEEELQVLSLDDKPAKPDHR